MNYRRAMFRLLIVLTIAWAGYWSWAYYRADRLEGLARKAVIDATGVYHLALEHDAKYEILPEFMFSSDNAEKVVKKTEAAFSVVQEDRRTARDFGLLGLASLWFVAAAGWWIIGGVKPKSERPINS